MNCIYIEFTTYMQREIYYRQLMKGKNGTRSQRPGMRFASDGITPPIGFSFRHWHTTSAATPIKDLTPPQHSAVGSGKPPLRKSLQGFSAETTPFIQSIGPPLFKTGLVNRTKSTRLSILILIAINFIYVVIN